MSDPVLRTLQLVNAAAFLMVGLVAFRDWWHGRDRSRGYIAIALGGLGLVALAGPLEPLTNYARGMTAALILLLMASGAGLLLYRNRLLPLATWARVVAVVGLGGTTVFALAVGVPGNPTTTATPVQTAAGLLLVLAWSASVVEPAYRLSRRSVHLAAVQRARLRSLSAGYSGIVLVIFLSLDAALLGGNPLVQDGLQLVALGCVPLLYFGFAPPRWLRRIWRQPEEAALLGAIQELLLFSPDRATLARRGLDWGIRLIGGDAGLIADAGPELLAYQGMTEADATALLHHPDLAGLPPVLALDNSNRVAIVHHLQVETGPAVMIIVPGDLSPAFGPEEIERTAAYAASITIALDRSRVSELAYLKEVELSRARDAAEAASRAKSEFLSRMSHELRTPLTAMLGFAELLTLDDLDDQQRRYTTTILKAGDHLLALINDVLDIARIEEGQLSMSLEPIQVREVLTEVLDLSRPMAGVRGISVQVLEVAGTPFVIADHQRLKQVLLNLVSNAVKYNVDRGSVQIGMEPDNGHLRITVADTGRGLREDEILRLFSPFERLGATRTDIEGTGLGLALSKSLTEAMRGRIGVESTPGEGSVFWIELPIAPADMLHAEQLPGEPIPSPTVQAPARIVLLVEDTISNINLVEGILTRRPHITLIPAMLGSLAMELARQNHPDLILLDVHLPDIEGLDLLQQFRVDPATAAVPVIMLSADATQHQVERFMAAGAEAYLTKPIRVNTLLAALDKHLSPIRTEV